MNAKHAVRLQRIILGNALLPDGWTRDVEITIDNTGEIDTVRTGIAATGDLRLDGFCLPAMANAHSHAFQRVLSGLTERGRGNSDNFWGWRERMYAVAGIIDAAELYDIACQLYMEMLQAGYTSVAEFHYLHHRPDGSPYGNPAETSLMLLQAACDTGIHLTLLPALYMRGGFDMTQAEERQRRFIHPVEDYCRLLESLSVLIRQTADARLGIALHSLRAVAPDAIDTAVTTVLDLDPSAPIHIHIAEQQKEVEDCLRNTGLRPVAWLLERQPVGENWCLVHATHMNDTETAALAATGAVAGLCPTTEANLGDGIFPLRGYLEQGGRIAIGSDSNVSVDPVEELRWLEYGQRLAWQRRNVAVDAAGSSGAGLYLRAAEGGAAACGLKTGVIAPGYRADIVCLDDQSPQLYAKHAEYILDSHVFSGNDRLVKDVIAGGRWAVRNYRHVNQDAIRERYRIMLKDLYGRLV